MIARPALHRPLSILAGAVAVLLALWWLPRCVRAERASLLHREACCGPSSNDVSAVLALAERAYALDRANYHFWALAAGDAWDALPRTGDAKMADMYRKRAREWTGRALEENPWHPKSRVMWAAMLAESDPAQALRYWRECVEWQYWEPFNHAFLAELLARNGDFAGASNALERIRGMRYYDDTRAILDRLEGRRR